MSEIKKKRIIIFLLQKYPNETKFAEQENNLANKLYRNKTAERRPVQEKSLLGEPCGRSNANFIIE